MVESCWLILQISNTLLLAESYASQNINAMLMPNHTVLVDIYLFASFGVANGALKMKIFFVNGRFRAAKSEHRLAGHGT
jgi:hypothetical protein